MWVTIGRKGRAVCLGGEDVNNWSVYPLLICIPSPWGRDRSDDYFSGVFRDPLKEIHMRVAVSIQATMMYARDPEKKSAGKQSSQGAKGWDERRGKGLQCH